MRISDWSSDVCSSDLTGEHGGRLLQQDGYTVELAMAEDGAPPRFQAWLYEDGEPLPASSGKVEVRVTRLGGRTESYTLAPQEDGSLAAAKTVAEPHSFEVRSEEHTSELQSLMRI